MARLVVTLFGQLQVSLDGAPLTGLRTARLQSLFAYLVLERGQLHPRDQLAARFWPDEPDTVARQNLRQALYQLRQLFDQREQATAPLLLLTHDQVQFNPNRDCQTDVDQFLAAFQQGQLAAAVDVYSADLLTGLHATSNRFEEWLLLRREDLHLRALAALATLTTTALQQHDLTQAAHYARRQLALEPWLEAAHRQLMMALAATGERSAALAQYETCCRVLAEELAVAPDAETQALAAQIRNGTFDQKSTLPAEQAAVTLSPTAPAAATPPQPLVDWGEAPEVSQLHGREAEMRTLTRWLTADRCRLVAMVGMGGMGKTTLAAAVARQVNEHFDVVIWRSLLNAPALEEIVQSWLRLLGEAPTVQSTLDQRLAQLFGQLQKRRCLLILDNVESILQSDESAGHYRPGYAAYGQLFKRFGETNHQSTLVLTSREAPQEVVRLVRERPTSQVLALAGLAAEAGQAILRRQGTHLPQAAVDQLVARYSGNPLALLLVGETIQELFAGDVTAFLAQPLIFDDIRDVLDQQWQRLSPLERDLLLWLAIEREPLTLAQLQANLYPPVPMPHLIEAVNSLRRRSLLERQEEHSGDRGGTNGAGFLLQNVVTEYLTGLLVAQICTELHENVLHYFHSHALLKAQAKEYVRQSQRRLIVQPIVEQLQISLGRSRLMAHLNGLLTHLRTVDGHTTGYGAGNLLNLLVQLGMEGTPYDFAGLTIRQADLADAVVQGVNFAGCHFAGCRFTDTFAAITALTFRADGQQLIAGTALGNIRFWRTHDGQPLGVWQAHTNYVFSVLVSPDGARLYSCSDDQSICCWDLGQEVDQLQTPPTLRYRVRGHGRGVWRLTLSPNGRLLASAGGDGVIVLWDAATGVERTRFHEHARGTRSVAIDPAGELLAAGGEEGLVVVWRIADGTVLARLHDHHTSVLALAFSPDGALLAAGNHDHTIHLWQVATLRAAQRSAADRPTVTTPFKTQQMLPGRLLHKHTGPVSAVAFHPNGALLASSSADGSVCLWRLGDGQPTATFYGHSDEVTRVLFSPDGTLLASGSADRTICLWTVAGGQLVQRLHGHVQGVMGLALTADGTVLASAHQDRQVRLWDAAQRALTQPLPLHQSEVLCVAWHPNGQLLASGSIDHTIQLWDRQQGRVHGVLRGHRGWVRRLCFQRDGTELISCGTDWSVRHWQVTTGTLLRTIEPGYSVWAIALSPDEATLAIGGTQGTVQLLTWPAGNVRLTLHGHTNWVTALAYSPDGTLLASGGGDQQLRLWDAHTGNCLYTGHGHSSWIYSAAFNATGDLLATAGADGKICLWEIKPLQLRHQFQGHSNEVRAVIFSADGSMVLSGSTDETLRWWDVVTGSCLATVHAPRPYEDMQIADVSGLTAAQLVNLQMLGAVSVGRGRPPLGTSVDSAQSPSHGRDTLLSGDCS